MVVGIVLQSNGTILYRIKSSTREQLAHTRERTERYRGIKSPEPQDGQG